MAKQSKSVVHKQVNFPQGKGTSIEQYETVDDNLIPDSEELEKYKNIDPTLIAWFKSRAEQEQNHRHDFNNKRIRLANKVNNFIFTIQFISLFFVTVLCIACFYFSYLVIINGNSVLGSVLAGGGLLVIVINILNFAKNKNQNNQQPSKK